MTESEVHGCLEYYDLERYLFGTVGPKFRKGGILSAFDFFSIIVWKSNRSKSTTAKRLKKLGAGKPWDVIIGELAATIMQAGDRRSKLAVLIEGYGFHLPTASAILTVLWPDLFSVYDVRVCGVLGRFSELAENTKMESLWPGYEQYIESVRHAVPGGLSLRDKDRVLWALSARTQLKRDMSDWLAQRDNDEETE